MSIKIVIIAKLFALIIMVDTGTCENVQVTLKQGIVSGKQKESFFNKHQYFAFRGIPYAEPPVGDLRFKPPIENKGWENTLKAYNNKPTCLQFSSRMRMNEKFGISGSEDCLFVNVFTPSLEGSHAVVVFDYNDNFKTGFNGTNTYSPDFFIDEGVVTVTISHRLGLFGYLTTQNEVIPPNIGIRDFILGLQWIKDNIKKFGGDPNRVTLMGSKGGATLANILLYSKAATGLFHAVIMQSGSALEPTYFYDKAKEATTKFAKHLEIEITDDISLLNDLQKMDPEILVGNDYATADNEQLYKYQISSILLSPVIENDHPNAIITTLPEQGKIVNDVPILMGLNSREGLDLAAHFIADPRLVKEMNQDIMMHFPVRTNFRFDKNATLFEDMLQEIKDFYFRVGYFDYKNILEYAVYIADVLQNYAIDLTAKKLSEELESPVFYYMFDYRGLLNENSEHLAKRARETMKHWGATIGDELCYLHLCSRIRRVYKELNDLLSVPVELKVLKKTVRLWANFIKTGNPTPRNNDDILKDFIWEPIERNSSDKKYLHITKKLYMAVNPLGNRTKFWDDFLRKYSEMAVDGVVQDNEKGRDEL